MTVILINPNSTEAMTQSAVTAARRAAPSLTFEGWTSAEGPPAIEGAEDGERAIPPMLRLVQKASDAGASVIILACFDDTGLAEARAMAACPVIGIGQASYVMSGLLAGPTAVITTVQAAVPVIEANVAEQGHASRIRRILAADVPVLTLEHDPQTAARAFEAAARHLPDDTANVIIGCAGAVTVTGILEERLPFRLLDGVTAAARLSKAFTD